MLMFEKNVFSWFLVVSPNFLKHDPLTKFGPLQKISSLEVYFRDRGPIGTASIKKRIIITISTRIQRNYNRGLKTGFISLHGSYTYLSCILLSVFIRPVSNVFSINPINGLIIIFFYIPRALLPKMVKESLEIKPKS